MYLASDRRLIEHAVDAEIKEKASQAALLDIVHHERWKSEYPRWLLAWTRRSKGIMLIGTVDGEPAGFVVCVPEFMNKTSKLVMSFARPFYMLEIYVLPRFRRSGIAALLLRRAEEWARSKGCDWLRTAYHTGYRWGTRLVLSAGFRPSVVIVAKPIVRSRTRKKDRG